MWSKWSRTWRAEPSRCWVRPPSGRCTICASSTWICPCRATPHSTSCRYSMCCFTQQTIVLIAVAVLLVVIAIVLRQTVLYAWSYQLANYIIYTILLDALRCRSWRASCWRAAAVWRWPAMWSSRSSHCWPSSRATTITCSIESRDVRKFVFYTHSLQCHREQDRINTWCTHILFNVLYVTWIDSCCCCRLCSSSNKEE